jgi:NADH:ubiquinone oxidoreductase subunit 3 (subunit A)
MSKYESDEGLIDSKHYNKISDNKDLNFYLLLLFFICFDSRLIFFVLFVHLKDPALFHSFV